MVCCSSPSCVPRYAESAAVPPLRLTASRGTCSSRRRQLRWSSMMVSKPHWKTPKQLAKAWRLPLQETRELPKPAHIRPSAAVRQMRILLLFPDYSHWQDSST